mgnify:CR=1 FL=1
MSVNPVINNERKIECCIEMKPKAMSKAAAIINALPRGDRRIGIAVSVKNFHFPWH